MIVYIGYLILGLFLLVAGGEGLIRGALSAARLAGVSPLLTGIVVIGFGTSAPELVVSVDAVLNDQPDLAIGNVVGSNIANILLILGISGMVTRLTVTTWVLRRDAIALVIGSAIFMMMSADGVIKQWEGIILIVLFTAYLVVTVITERKGASPYSESGQISTEVVVSTDTVLRALAFVGIGLIFLIAGSRLFLTGAIQIADYLGVSSALVGLTVVAVGTSLPELTVSVMAAIRGKADLAVGNVLGSNLFNLLGVLGVATCLTEIPIHDRISIFDQWVMFGTSVLLLIFLKTGRSLNRLESAVLLGGYVLYALVGFLQFSQ